MGVQNDIWGWAEVPSCHRGQCRRVWGARNDIWVVRTTFGCYERLRFFGFAQNDMWAFGITLALLRPHEVMKVGLRHAALAGLKPATTRRGGGSVYFRTNHPCRLPLASPIMKMGSALFIVVPGPEPESRGGVVVSRRRGKQEEAAASYFQRNRHDRALQGDHRSRAFTQTPGFLRAGRTACPAFAGSVPNQAITRPRTTPLPPPQRHPGVPAPARRAPRRFPGSLAALGAADTPRKFVVSPG